MISTSIYTPALHYLPNTSRVVVVVEASAYQLPTVSTSTHSFPTFFSPYLITVCHFLFLFPSNLNLLFIMKEKNGQHPFRKFEIKELNFCSTHSLSFVNYKKEKNFRLFVDEREQRFYEVSTSSDKKVTYHCVTVTDDFILPFFSSQPYLARPEPFFRYLNSPMSVHFWPYFRYCHFKPVSALSLSLPHS